MSHNDGIITVDTGTGAGIWINNDALTADIQAVLATSLSDIGSIIGQTSINKWAKYKPVKRHGLDFPRQRNSDFTWKTIAQIEALSEVPWWIGEDGQFGLTFQTYPSLGSNTITTENTFLYELLAGNLGWGYERPTGGSSQYPYRFFDFNYYSHYAPKPVTGVYDNLRLISNGNNTYNLTIQLDQTRALNDLGIQLSDLIIGQSAVSGWYVGILIYKSASQFTFAFTENAIGTNEDLSVYFPVLDGSYAGSATVVPFLSSVHSTQQGVDPGAGVFLSCDVAPQSVTINPAIQGVQLEIYAQFGFAHAFVKSTVNIINNNSTQIEVRNLYVKLYDGYQYLYNESEGDVTIPAHSSHSFSYTGRDWPIVNYDSSRNYSVIVESDYPEVNGQQAVDEPRNS